MKLTRSLTGDYEVLFGFPDGWEQREGAIVGADGPQEAVAAAYRIGGWRGAPWERHGVVQPTYARVRYSTPELPRDQGCQRDVATIFFGSGSVYEHLPVFRPCTPLGMDLGNPNAWWHVTERHPDEVWLHRSSPEPLVTDGGVALTFDFTLKSDPSTTIRKGAQLSNCGRFRYTLWRDGLAPGARTVAFVMLNPSTADALVDDPTIRRCVSFATSWGFSRLEVVNLYAFRATDPSELPADELERGTGIEAEAVLRSTFLGADLVVCAWGAAKQIRRERVRHVLDLIRSCGRQPHCIAVSTSGGRRGIRCTFGRT